MSQLPVYMDGVQVGTATVTVSPDTSGSSRFDIIVERQGISVTIKNRTLSGYDSYGNPVWTYSAEANEKAIINFMRGDERLVLSGELEVGDAIGYFKTNSVVADGKRVTVGSTDYQVLSVIPIYLRDSLSHYEAKLRRVTD